MIDDHPEPPLCQDQCGRSADSPAGSSDHRNTTHQCYLRLGPCDIEIEHRTPSGGMVLTRREASN